MTHKRKTIIGIGLLCLAALALYPFAQSLIANHRLEEYALAKYKVDRLERKASFNIVNGSYDTQLSIGEGSYRLSYDFSNHSIYDLYMIEQQNAEENRAFEAVKPHLPSNLTFPAGINLFSGINPEDYTQIKQRLYLTGIYNSEDIAEKDSKRMPAAITMQIIDLLGKQYNITAVQVIYYDQNGGYTIEIGLTNSYTPVTKEQLLSHTKKMDSSRLGENYTKWLASR